MFPCNCFKIDRSFGGRYGLHIECRGASQARKQRAESLSFDPEDSSEIVVDFQRTTSHYIQEDRIVMYHRREDLVPQTNCSFII
jgi:hypothetical protein